MKDQEEFKKSCEYVKSAKKYLDDGEFIEGQFIRITCLSCGKTSTNYIQSSQRLHKVYCILHYYVVCPKCNYQNNLSEFRETEHYLCTCKIPVFR